MIKVLFVCMGNYCRSPLAEGHFQKLIEEHNLIGKISCDSAGTHSYHIDELPDMRTRKNALGHGLELNHRARQIRKDDFQQFDYIFAMDSSNLADINYLGENTKDAKAKVFMMRHFDPQAINEDVPDPYWGGPSGFEDVYQILERSARNFMNFLKKEHNL